MNTIAAFFLGILAFITAPFHHASDVAGSGIGVNGNVGSQTLILPVSVANGGTGAASFTGSQLLYSNAAGTSILTAASSTLYGTGTSGQVLGWTNGLPGWVATSSSSSVVGSGVLGQFPYYAAAGTALTATSSIFLSSNGNLGIGTSSPQSRLAVSGGATIGADYNLAAPTNGLLMEGAAAFGDTSTHGSALRLVAVGGATLFSGGGNGDFSIDANGVPSGRFIIKDTSGNVGIGTSSPYAKFSINALSTDTNTTLFAIASSTASATTLMAVNNVGDLIFTGDSTMRPTLGSCGTGAQISATSTDLRGTIKTGTGSPTTCQLIFAHPKADTPTPIVSDGSTAVTIDIQAASTTGILYSVSAALNSTNIYYWNIQ